MKFGNYKHGTTETQRATMHAMRNFVQKFSLLLVDERFEELRGVNSIIIF